MGCEYAAAREWARALLAQCQATTTTAPARRAGEQGPPHGPLAPRAACTTVLGGWYKHSSATQATKNGHCLRLEP